MIGSSRDAAERALEIYYASHFSFGRTNIAAILTPAASRSAQLFLASRGAN